MKKSIITCVACSVFTMFFPQGAIAQQEGEFGFLGASENGDSLRISNGRNTLDLNGLLSGSLSVSNPNEGKSVQIGENGSLDLNNRHRKGKIRFDRDLQHDEERGSIHIEEDTDSAEDDLEQLGSLFLNSGKKSVSLQVDWRSKGAQESRQRPLNDTLKLLGAKRSKNQIELDLSSDVLFDFDSTGIKPEAARTLAEVAILIRRTATGKVIVRGHTDSRGSRDYNQSLSEERAQAVVNWLRGFEEIPGNLLSAMGLGESQPVAPNQHIYGGDNPDGRAKNRRVEIVIRTNS